MIQPKLDLTITPLMSYRELTNKLQEASDLIQQLRAERDGEEDNPLDPDAFNQISWVGGMVGARDCEAEVDNEPFLNWEPWLPKSTKTQINKG